MRTIDNGLGEVHQVLVTRGGGCFSILIGERMKDMDYTDQVDVVHPEVLE